MFSRMMIARRLALSYGSLAMAALVAGAVGLGTAATIRAGGDHVAGDLAPLVDATMEVKLTGAEARRLYEEAVKGKDPKIAREAGQALDEATFFARAVLEGGKNDEGTFVATTDPDVGAHMKTVLAEIDRFRRAASDLVATAMTDGSAGSGVDQAFDESYEQAQDRLAAAVETVAETAGPSAADHQAKLGEARYRLANGHLYLEELLSGDPEVKVEDVVADFNAAAGLAREVGNDAAVTAAGLAEAVAKLATTRVEGQHARADHTAQVEKRFTESYASFISAADQAETLVQRAMEQGVAEFDTTASRGTVAVGLVTLLAMIFAWWLNRSMTRRVSLRIGRLSDVMRRLARGEQPEVPSLDSPDEIGEMARATEVFSRYAEDIRKLDAERAALAEENARSRALLARDFEAEIGGAIDFVLSAGEELSRSAATMVRIAGDNRDEAAAAAGASSQARGHTATVAGAAEEIASAAENIAGRLHQASGIVDRAASDAARSSDNVAALTRAAERIGSAVSLIQSIADQTNLLALNATIEAARAGEAGKGFAVVASEVKALAGQTAKATEEISGVVGSIQASTDTTVEAISEIVGTIGRIREIVVEIAGAVEEQGAATQTVSANAQAAAADTASVEGSVARVTRAAGEADAAARQVAGAAVELTEQANAVRRSVTTFVAKVSNG